ncbi:uncharacterized protein B0H18DRAFT_1047149 [Fomitopsis serialis]|uniref:uncharacterized protein n=1 Tax=Fomitopsis serialis TaxID=139415 RepID=UPI0020076B90|nr:uncharacterized protein B0H18DRAFT_1047149 [Neoantrodia serialis]KAH9913931.1 hypothetical protein B0H18DRAFT_1047149 [Neoantrodia serialis]
MKCFSLPVFLLPTLVAAHNAANHHARQAASSTSGAAAASSVVASGSAGSALPSTVTFSFISTNPTAIPLSEIRTGTAQTQSTIALSTTYQASATQTYVPNAPGLPSALPVPSNYPTLDKTPPTDSDEVQQWIQEVMNSGVDIPDIPVTNPGACANNTAAVANASTNCWWTCGGCTRSTDVASCPTKNAWGVSYDDGPSPYTPNLLQYFAQQDLRATFFAIGSRIMERPAILQDEYMSGNQVAVHTWSHPYMTTKTTPQVIAELGWTKKLIKDTLGVTPVYWRPPYGDIDDRVRAISTAMNLIPIVWTRISSSQTFDTNDWDIPAGTTNVFQVLDNWAAIMDNSTKIDTGFIVLEHDLYEQTVDVATGYILPQALAHTPKYNMTPIVECLNEPLANAYLETNDNSSHPLPLASVQATHTGSLSAGASSTGGSSSGNSSGSLSKANVGSVLLTAIMGSILAVVALTLH